MEDRRMKVWRIVDSREASLLSKEDRMLKESFVADECLKEFSALLDDEGHSFKVLETYGNGDPIKGQFWLDPGGMVMTGEPKTSLDVYGYKFEFFNGLAGYAQSASREALKTAEQDGTGYVLMPSWPTRLICFSKEMAIRLDQLITEKEAEIIRVFDEFMELREARLDA